VSSLIKIPRRLKLEDTIAMSVTVWSRIPLISWIISMERNVSKDIFKINKELKCLLFFLYSITVMFKRKILFQL